MVSAILAAVEENKSCGEEWKSRHPVLDTGSSSQRSVIASDWKSRGNLLPHKGRLPRHR